MEFVDLEERALGSHALEEASRPAPDAHRVPVDQLGVDCLLRASRRMGNQCQPGGKVRGVDARVGTASARSQVALVELEAKHPERFLAGPRLRGRRRGVDNRVGECDAFENAIGPF